MKDALVQPSISDILRICKLRSQQHRNNIRLAHKYFLKLFIFILVCAFATQFAFQEHYTQIGYGILGFILCGVFFSGAIGRYRHLHSHQERFADFYELKQKIKKDPKAELTADTYYQELQSLLQKPFVQHTGFIFPR